MERQLSARQMSASRQAALGIEGSIRALVRELELLSRTPAVQRIDPVEGRAAMQHTLSHVRALSVNDA